MADKKISALTSATTPLAGTEVLPIVQGGATVKVAVSDLTPGLSTITTAKGGTNLTSFTANGVVYASSTSALATGSALTFDGTNFATTGTATATKLIPTGSSATGNGLYLPAANSVGISTNGTNAVYINSSQNVGIGTSSPQRTLHSNGGASDNCILATSAAGNAYIGFADVGTTDQTGLSVRIGSSGNGLLFQTGGTTTRMAIDSAGIVTMSAYGAGAATFSASGVISSVSDETWKIKDGVPVDPDSMLKKLEPGYWYYNDEKKETFGVDRQLGFYAQNVNAAIGPEAAPTPETVISKAEDGTDIVTTKPWGYYDRSVLAVTVMSLQKALATIESLTARIEALEAK